MSNQLFAIGDVHGKYRLVQDLLQKWDKTTQQLVFIGDLIDRGEDSKSCLELVCRLVREEGAVCLMGNHEWMFLRYLDDPTERYDHYQRNGGDTTINSLLGRPLDAQVDPVSDAVAIVGQYAEMVDQIREFPYLYETQEYLFVHAGLDLSLPDVRETADYDKVWLRQPFHEGQNQTGKRIVFGHTPTKYLFDCQDYPDQIWTTEDGKIGIDGGAVYGGYLHGVALDETGVVKVHSVGETLSDQTIIDG
ncbi:metallophosphoesterase [Streptococcus ovuberis]|uniref:Serine/threonine protein phosphatase n=1 Tax=Streptococcus ovuberis TaxID=1936207 RepID=A0A7X6MXG0_9STRE|nr:metallophosphoesterase [Streptococcus ovuberis]NKZ20155.1 serine/threonine protein phosphatase [Streptococcus ovuberis]